MWLGIATCNGLDGPGIESRWRRGFPHPFRPARDPPNHLYNGYQVFPRGKVAGAWRWPPSSTSAEVKEGVELYLYSPSGPLWPVVGWTLPYCTLFLSNRSLLTASLRVLRLRTKDQPSYIQDSGELLTKQMQKVGRFYTLGLGLEIATIRRNSTFVQDVWEEGVEESIWQTGCTDTKRTEKVT